MAFYDQDNDDEDDDNIPLIRRRRPPPHNESSSADDDAPASKRHRQLDTPPIQTVNAAMTGLKEKLALLEAAKHSPAPAARKTKRTSTHSPTPASSSPTARTARQKRAKNATSSSPSKTATAVAAAKKKTKKKKKDKSDPAKDKIAAQRDSDTRNKQTQASHDQIPLAKEERFEIPAADLDTDAAGGVHRWWDDDGKDNEIKWQTLAHHGVIFPPEYTPHRVPFGYEAELFTLSSESEEVATFYAAKLKTDYVTKTTFNKNFFTDFKKILAKHDPPVAAKVKALSQCDFTHIWEHLEKAKNAKKELRPAERKKMREDEAAKVAKYTVALVDGREEKIGNFRLEPPGLFMGRGEHPLAGSLKGRVMPEDVTINIGKNDPVPECPIPGRKWGKVIHNNTVTWLAMWKDTITSSFKYVWLGAGSKFKGMSDHQKFEKARKLHGVIDKIRSDYKAGFRSNKMSIRQRSVAIYLIDKLALRVGNEKGEDEADTVGCCSLRKEHISFQEPRTIEFDFLGKDSIRYVNSVEVEIEVFKNMKRFVKEKDDTGDIFDRLTTTGLNEYLKELMPGLSAKVFRTYNASVTLSSLLQNTPSDQNATEKLVFYNQQNKEVAILCNHQRALPKAHDSQMEKMTQRLQETEEWLEELESALAKLAKSKKLESIEVTQWSHVKPELLPEMNDRQRAEAKEVAAKKPRVKAKRTMKLEALQRNIAQTKERISKITADMQTKDDLKTVALGTSKINYLDPRITVAWCKRVEVPIEKVFTKTLLTKFAWAMETSRDFQF